MRDKADFSGTEPAVRASALAVRAMVECELSDVGAAHRLAEKAAALDPAARWVAEARRAVATRAVTG